MRVKDTVNGGEGEVLRVNEDLWEVKWDGYGGLTQWTNVEKLQVLNMEITISHRQRLLEETISIITKDRNNSYGEPDQDFTRIAALWNTYLADKETITSADVAVMMILLKVSRLSWNPSHKDSWLDVAGYAACGFETNELRSK